MDFNEKPNQNRIYRRELGKGRRINKKEPVKINIPITLKPNNQKYILNQEQQYISPDLNRRLLNNNNNNNYNAYKKVNINKKLEPEEKHGGGRAPMNSRPPSHIETNKKTPEPNDKPNIYINNKNSSIIKTSIDANGKEPTNTDTSKNCRINIQSKRSKEGLPYIKNFNESQGNKENNNIKENKVLNSGKSRQRGTSSYNNQKNIKGPNDGKSPSPKDFEVETPKNKGPNDGIKKSNIKESSNKLDTSSKKGKTNENFHMKKKMNLDPNFKEKMKDNKIENSNVMQGFRGFQNLGLIKKINSADEFNKAPNNEVELENLKKEISRLRNISQSNRATMNLKNKEIIDYRSKISEKDKEIKELHKQLEIKEKKFEEEKNKINFDNDKISELNKELERILEQNNKKDEEIENLKAENEKLNLKLIKLNDEYTEKKNIIQDLNNKEKIISQKDSEINELKAKLEQANLLKKKMDLEKEKEKKIKQNNINIEKKEKDLKKKRRKT